MSKSVEQDTKKSVNRQKAAKIIAIVAAVLLVGWTIYSIAMNLNQNERYILNSFVKYYREVEEPASYALQDCSEIRESITAAGKAFEYCIIEVEKAGKSEKLLLIVNGENKGTVYYQAAIETLDSDDKAAIRFEITQHEENVNMGKLQKTLKRYWQFLTIYHNYSYH